MTQQEFTKVISYLRTAYPTSNLFPTREGITTWYEELSDLNGQACMKAMREYVRSNDFPPTIASIRKSCTSQVKAFAKPWNEAWDDIMVAVRKYGLPGTIEAVHSLDGLTRKAVKAIGFYEICTSPKTGYLRREFKDIYEGYKKDYDSKIQASNGLIGIGETNKDQQLIG